MKNAIYDRRVNLLFPTRLAERAQARAAADEQSMSELIRQALREYLDESDRVAA